MPAHGTFYVATPSRHPANQSGYDGDQHRYHPGYVAPDDWRLDLVFLPTGLREVAEGRFALPPDVTALEWTVAQVQGSFTTSVTRRQSSLPRQLLPHRRDVTTEVRIPAPAEYAITLSVHLADGTRETSTATFLLRDYLVVGIGDSFASGQGNPDVAAVAAPDQRIACKFTSLAIVGRRLQESIDNFASALKREGLDVVDYLPYAGKVVAAGAAGVDNVAEFIQSQVDDLKDKVVEVGRDAATAVVEGAEEFLGIFGIGDGGESDEARPHPAAWQEPLAYRSYRSGQSLAARQAETDYPMGADRITFLGFGRTGSEVDRGLLGPRTFDQVLGEKDVSFDHWVNDRGQIAEARDTVQGRRVDVLIVTVGINDLGFSGLVTRAILKASGEKRRERVEGARRRVASDFPDSLDRLRKAIDDELAPRHVVITEYPVNIFKEIADGTKDPCGVLASVVPNPATGTDLEGLNLDRSDASDFTEVGALLNAKIREKAHEFGWELVDGIERGFEGHGYCADKPFFVSAEESCLRQGDFEGMLHPNASGQAVARDNISAVLRRQLVAPSEQWLSSLLHVMMA